MTTINDVLRKTYLYLANTRVNERQPAQFFADEFAKIFKVGDCFIRANQILKIRHFEDAGVGDKWIKNGFVVCDSPKGEDHFISFQMIPSTNAQNIKIPARWLLPSFDNIYNVVLENSKKSKAEYKNGIWNKPVKYFII